MSTEDNNYRSLLEPYAAVYAVLQYGALLRAQQKLPVPGDGVAPTNPMERVGSQFSSVLLLNRKLSQILHWAGIPFIACTIWSIHGGYPNIPKKEKLQAQDILSSWSDLANFYSFVAWFLWRAAIKLELSWATRAHFLLFSYPVFWVVLARISTSWISNLSKAFDHVYLAAVDTETSFGRIGAVIYRHGLGGKISSMAFLMFLCAGHFFLRMYVGYLLGAIAAPILRALISIGMNLLPRASRKFYRSPPSAVHKREVN